LTSELIPPNFEGDDIRKVYEKLNLPAKTEFETSEQYRQRTEKVLSNSQSQMYAFRIETGKTPDKILTIPKIEYFPEPEIFTLDIFRYPASDVRGSLFIISVVHKTPITGTGTNAYGGRVKIDRYSGDGHGIIASGDFQTLTFRAKVPREKAQATKPLIGLLLVCRPDQSPAGGLTDTVRILREPTFDIPFALDYAIKTIRMRIVSAWIYNQRTGEILNKDVLN
jgi:hypothetical protein